MSGETVPMLIEDHDYLGPAAFSGEVGSYPTSRYMAAACFVEVPRAQAQRWEDARVAWEGAQAEMRDLLQGARRERNRQAREASR